MQKLRLSAEFEGEYGDAQVKIAVSVLVYSGAFVDEHQENILFQRVTASVGS